MDDLIFGCGRGEGGGRKNVCVCAEGPYVARVRWLVLIFLYGSCEILLELDS